MKNWKVRTLFGMILGIYSFLHSSEVDIGTGFSNYGGLLKSPYLGKQAFHFTPYLALQADRGNLFYRLKSQFVWANKYCIFCGEKLNVSYIRISQEIKYPIYRSTLIGGSLGYQYQQNFYKFPKCQFACDDWSAEDHLAGTVVDKENIIIPQILVQKQMNKFETTFFLGFPFEISSSRKKNIFVKRGWDGGGYLRIPEYSEKQKYGILVELNFGYRLNL